MNRFLFGTLFVGFVACLSFAGCARPETSPTMADASAEEVIKNPIDPTESAASDSPSWNRKGIVLLRSEHDAMKRLEPAPETPPTDVVDRNWTMNQLQRLGSDSFQPAVRAELALPPDPKPADSEYEIAKDLRIPMRTSTFVPIENHIPFVMASRDGPYMLVGHCWKVDLGTLREADKGNKVQTFGSDPIRPVPVYDLRTGKVSAYFHEELPFFDPLVLSPNGMSAVGKKNRLFYSDKDYLALYVYTAERNAADHKADDPKGNSKKPAPPKKTPKNATNKNVKPGDEKKNTAPDVVVDETGPNKSSPIPVTVNVPPPRKLEIGQRVAAVQYIDNRRIAVLTLADVRELQFWDIAKGEMLSTAEVTTAEFMDLEIDYRQDKLKLSSPLLAVSPGGAYVAVSSSKQIDILETKTGTVVGNCAIQLGGKEIAGIGGLWFNKSGDELRVALTSGNRDEATSILVAWRLSDGVRTKLMRIPGYVNGFVELDALERGHLLPSRPSIHANSPWHWITALTPKMIDTGVCLLQFPTKGPLLAFEQPTQAANRVPYYHVAAVDRTAIEANPEILKVTRATEVDSVAVNRNAVHLVTIPSATESLNAADTILEPVPPHQPTIAVSNYSSPNVLQSASTSLTWRYDSFLNNKQRMLLLLVTDLLKNNQYRLDLGEALPFAKLSTPAMDDSNRRVALIRPDTPSKVTIWDVFSDSQITFTPSAGRVVEAVVWFDEHLVCLVEGELSVWKIGDKSIEKLSETRGGGYAAPIQVSPSKKRLAASRGSACDLFDGLALKLIRRFVPASGGPIIQFSFSPDEAQLAAWYSGAVGFDDIAPSTESKPKTLAVGVWGCQTGEAHVWKESHFGNALSWVSPSLLCCSSERGFELFDTKHKCSAVSIDNFSTNGVSLHSSPDGTLWSRAINREDPRNSDWTLVDIRKKLEKRFPALFDEDRVLIELRKFPMVVEMAGELALTRHRAELEQELKAAGYQLESGGFQLRLAERVLDSNLTLKLPSLGADDAPADIKLPMLAVKWSIIDPQGREIWKRVLNTDFIGKWIRYSGKRPEKSAVLFERNSSIEEIRDAFRPQLIELTSYTSRVVPEQIVVGKKETMPIPLKLMWQTLAE